MKNAKKITSILIMAGMSMVMFAGCGSTTASATNTNTKASQMSQKTKFDPTAIKTLYSNTLKTLVTAKTITQAQSDKVLAAVTVTVPKGTSSGGTKKTYNKNSANKPNGTRTNNNRLTALVTSGVITQTQADAINTKISTAMKVNRSKQSN